MVGLAVSWSMCGQGSSVEHGWVIKIAETGISRECVGLTVMECCVGWVIGLMWFWLGH